MNTPSATDRRIAALTTGAVLRTLAGTQVRIAALDWADVTRLMRHYGCSLQELPYAMSSSRYSRRRRELARIDSIVTDPMRGGLFKG